MLDRKPNLLKRARSGTQEMAFFHLSIQPAPGNRDCVLSICGPEDGQLRCRKVVTRSQSRPTGKYPSLKMRRMMQWESPGELNALRLLDADSTVGWFFEQPCCITYVIDGVVHEHFPDVLIEAGTVATLGEVKTAEESLNLEVVRRTRLLQERLPDFGLRYQLLLAEDLSREPRMSNVKTLLHLARRPISDIDRECLRQLIVRSQSICWGTALQGDLGPRGRTILARAFIDGLLEFDIDHPLSTSTMFHSPCSRRDC